MKGFLMPKEELPAVARQTWKSVKSLEGDELCANPECNHQRRYHLYTDGLCGYSETFCACTKFVHSNTYQDWATGAELLTNQLTRVIEPLRSFLHEASRMCVVVGEVARSVANAQTLDLLWGMNSEEDTRIMLEMCEKHHLKFESPFPHYWIFRDYGWTVKIVGTHEGYSYRAFKTIRARASRKDVDGLKLLVARTEDAPEPGIKR